MTELMHSLVRDLDLQCKTITAWCKKPGCTFRVKAPLKDRAFADEAAYSHLMTANQEQEQS